MLAQIFTQAAARGEAVYSSFAQESAHADMCWHRIRGVIDRPSRYLYQHREKVGLERAQSAKLADFDSYQS